MSAWTVREIILFISNSFSSLDSMRVVMPGMLRSIFRNRRLPLQMAWTIGSFHLPLIGFLGGFLRHGAAQNGFKRPEGNKKPLTTVFR